MTRKTRSVVEQPIDHSEDDAKTVNSEIDLIDEGTDFDEYLHTVLAEVGEDVKQTDFVLKVYQVVPNAGQLAWLFNCTPSELPILERLRDDYGGGQFEIRIYRNNRIFRRKTIIVKSPVNRPVKQDDTALAKLMVEGFNRIADKLSNINTGSNVPAIVYDPAKMMESMVGIMSTMQKLQPAVPNNDNNNQVEMLLKGIELATRFNENKVVSGESTMLDVVRDFLHSPLLAQIAEQKRIEGIQGNESRSVRQLDNRHVQAQQTAETEQMSESQIVPTEDQQLLEMKHYYVNMLLQKAQQGSDPELYAEYILDNVPDHIVKEHFTGPDVIQELIVIQPLVSEQREWFEHLRKSLIEMLSDEDEPGQQDEALKGDNSVVGDSNSIDANS